MKNANRWLLIPVWAGMVIVPLVSGLSTPTPQSVEQANAKQKTVHMRIAGMTCAGCAKGLGASFRNMAGVVKADVDYKAGQAIITFDGAKQSAESLSRFVTKCGYEVKETKVV